MTRSITILWKLSGFIAALSFLVLSRSATGTTFLIGERDFLLDGKPFIIRSGELHYPRIPREYCKR